MSLIFTDHAELTAAASKLARAQAEFDAAATQCNKIMLPKHTALQEANDHFKQIISKCAQDEAAALAPSIDLSAMAAAADEQAAAQLTAANQPETLN